MKFLFKPGRTWEAKDWVEMTQATPSAIGQASFHIREFREWFRRWVFK